MPHATSQSLFVREPAHIKALYATGLSIFVVEYCVLNQDKPDALSIHGRSLGLVYLCYRIITAILSYNLYTR